MTQKDKYGFRFRDWNIYIDARKFRKDVEKLLKGYPPEEKYALIDQTKRALSSIILNIAEGANRGTDKDTRLFINRAHTSLDEVVACLDCAIDENYINNRQLEEALETASGLAKRLRGFSNHLSLS